MASVTLTQVVVAPVSNLAGGLAAYSSGYPAAQTGSSAGGGSDTRKGQGQVRMYASGRARNIAAAGITRTFTTTLILVTYAQAVLLESWLNQTVLYRDTMGRKSYGVVNSVQISDYKDGGVHDVTFTVTEITYSESV